MVKTSLNESRILEDTSGSETPRAESGTIGSDLLGGKREEPLVQGPIRTKGRDAIEGGIITTITLKHSRGKRILGVRIGNRKESVEKKSGPLASETHNTKRPQPGSSLGLQPIIELNHVRRNIEMAHELYFQEEGSSVLRLIEGGVIVIDTVNEVLPRIVLEPLRKIRRRTTKMDVNIRGEKLFKMIC